MTRGREKERTTNRKRYLNVDGEEQEESTGEGHKTHLQGKKDNKRQNQVENDDGTNKG